MKFGHKTSFPIDVITSNTHRKIRVFKDLRLLYASKDEYYFIRRICKYVTSPIFAYLVP